MAVRQRLRVSFFQLTLVVIGLVDVNMFIVAEAYSDGNRNADPSPPASVGGGASSSNHELSRSDLVEALEKLSGGEPLSAAKAYKSTSEAMFDDRRSPEGGDGSPPSASARSAAAGGVRRLSDDDAALLHRLAVLVEGFQEEGRSSGQSAADGSSGGGVAANPAASGRPRVDELPASGRLGALLARLGEAHEQERRFFSNAGGRGKKQEAEPAPHSVDRLYEAVRELTSLVRDFIVTYREEKEETDRVIGVITQIIEKLVSYHVK